MISFKRRRKLSEYPSQQRLCDYLYALVTFCKGNKGRFGGEAERGDRIRGIYGAFNRPTSGFPGI